jgi:hypothetical protein
LAVTTALVGCAMTGCGGVSEDDVEGVATDFYSALADGNGQAACELLAPATRSELEKSAGKPCPQAIVDEQLPNPSASQDVAVFDTAGEVRFDTETTFLSEFPDGWKVVAAGCTPKPEHPYDCVLTGG